MARATKEEALETRSRILDAAEDVFHLRGVSGTTLADIAAAADVTRGAIYWHFQNKGDLFNGMCERLRLPLDAIIDGDTAMRDHDPLGQFLKAAVAMMHEVATNPHTHKVFDILFNKCEFVDPNDPILMRQRECFMQGREKIKRMLSEAVALQQLPPDLDIDIAYVMVHATFSGVLHDWLFAPGNFDLGRDAGNILAATIHMLKTAPTLRKA
jgi:TetR/AcrR family acrAB operon transcriptional repressor